MSKSKNPETPAVKFRFDTTNVEWKNFVTDGCYYRILDVNVPARTADMLVKFEPGARCLNHRHVARTMSFVLEGDLHVIERAVILCDGDTFSVDETWLTHDPKNAGEPSIPIGTSLAQQQRIQSETERQMIETALAATRGRIAGRNGAAAKLGIPRQTLDSKITALGIDKHRYRSH